MAPTVDVAAAILSADENIIAQNTWPLTRDWNAPGKPLAYTWRALCEQRRRHQIVGRGTKCA